MANLSFDENASSDPIDGLFPSIIQCFGVIACGYLAGRLRLINSAEIKGINVFVSSFALPSLIFLAMAQLNFATVNWYFLLSLLISKLTLCCAAIAITLLVTRPLNFGRAGLIAIFCTQSNDLAIGTSIVKTLYGKTHPNYVDYLYLVAPINLVIINPFCMGFFEYTKFQREELNGHEERPKKSVIFTTVIKNVCANPLVFMTVLGIIWNLIFKRCVPVYISGCMTILEEAFTGSALFLLGLTMVGRVQSMRSNRLIVPSVIILAKLLALPLLTREIISIIKPGSTHNETVDFTTFGFLYGTFPTANFGFVLAIQYGIDVEMISAATVGCVFLSGPLMYISAKMITIGNISPNKYIASLNTYMLDLGIIGFLAGSWVLFVIVAARKIRKLPHQITACILISQIFICIGGILYGSLNTNNEMNTYFSYFFWTVGVHSSRFWAAFLAVTLLYIECGCIFTIEKLRPWFLILAWGTPILVMIVLVVAGWHFPNPYPNLDPGFTFEDANVVINVCILMVCLVVTVGCIVLQQRCQKQRSVENFMTESEFEEEVTPNNRLQTSQKTYSALPIIAESCSEDREELVPVEEGPDNRIELVDDEGDLQILRHTLLLISFVCSMFVSLAVSVWSLMISSYSGVYYELSFLEVALLCGQGIIIVMLFGLDVKNLSFWRHIWNRGDSLNLSDELDPGSAHVCEQFKTIHLGKCKEDISMDKRYRLRMYRKVFMGCALVEWLLEVGLVRDRFAAVSYGESLLVGQVIEQVTGLYHFDDSDLLFRFVENQC